VSFVWGDGHDSSGTTLSRSHTYTKPGRYTVAGLVTDSASQQSIATTAVTVGKPLSLKLSGPGSIKHGHKARFTAKAADPNTGGTPKSFTWNWGDGTTSSGRKASHTWHKAGRDKVVLTVRDTTGVVTKLTKKIRVH
jgi:PKD repeat protein